MALGWKVVYDGKTPPPGAAVAPDERLSWGRTVGLGAQHVVAMFGATFVFPLIMGLSPNLAIMMSGVATICFLLIVKSKVPSYLGTSASFVGGAAAIYAQGGGPPGRHRRDPGRRRGARAGRCGHPLPRLARRQRRAAAGGHRRGRHADRVQPRPGRGHDLHAGRPVGRAAHDDRRDPDGGRAARLPRPDRDLPRPDLRLRAVLARRPRLRPDHLAATRGRRGDHALAGRLVRRQSADWFGFPPQTPDGLVGNQFEAGNLAEVGWHLPELLARLRAARAAGGDRAGRREHRPRQGGRRDDRDRPRPGDGPRRSPPTASAP